MLNVCLDISILQIRRVFEEDVYNETLLYYQNSEMVKQINEHCKAHF